MPSCCAYGCSKNTKSYKLYRLPIGKRNELRRKQWLLRIGRDKWIPNENTKLCEVHFTEDQFESHRADKRRLLKQTAVPSIFCHRPQQKSRKTSKYVLLKDSVHTNCNDKQVSTETPEFENVISQNISGLDLQVESKEEFKYFISVEILPDSVVGAEPSLVLGSNSPITTVTLSDMVVELDPSAVITPDIKPPDLSEPGPSSRMEPDSSMMEQDIHLAMTCEVYPADAPRPDSLTTTVKKEPIDPDEQNIISPTVMQELRQFSKDSPLTGKGASSLFQPPVLIKEEPVSSDEESGSP